MSNDGDSTSSSSAAARVGHPGAPSRRERQTDPDPRARRLAAARERELGLRGSLRRQPIRPQGDLVRRQGQGVPAGIHYSVGGADEALRRGALSAAAPGLRRVRHHDGISPAWPISYDEMEPYYTKAEQLYEVHGNHGEDATEGHASAQYPFPACSTSRGSSSSRTTWSGRAITRSTHRAAFGCWPTTRSAARASGAGPAMASHACCSPSPMPTCWVSARLSSTTT